jgi:DNA-binding CsgD family transcriptional regulator
VSPQQVVAEQGPPTRGLTRAGEYAIPRELDGERRDGARRLLATLLDRVDAWRVPPEQPVPAATAEIVFDLVVDGMRYQLLRVPRGDARVALSSRELEIARMIANGHTNRTIAAVLDISPWTVSTHLRRVFAKLNVGSRAAMVAQLVANGVFAPKEEDSTRAGVRR